MATLGSFLEQQTLSQRLRVGFFIVVALLIAVGVQGIVVIDSMSDEFKSLYEVELRNVSVLKEAQVRLSNSASAVRQALLAQSQAEREALARDIHERRALIDVSLDEVRRRNSADEAAQLEKLEPVLRNYRRLTDQVLKSIVSGDVEGARAVMAGAAFSEAGRVAQDSLAELAATNERRARDNVLRMEAHYGRHVALALALLLACILLSSWVAYVVAGSIRRPLERLRSAIDELAQGRLDVVVPYADSPNELGGVARSVTVLQGKAQTLESELWVNSQVAEIGSRLQDCTSVEQLTQRFLDLTTPRLQAALASAYVVDTAEGVLRLTASCALTAEGAAARSTIKVGEGLVGRCAQSAEPISLSTLPGTYAVVSSGTGSSSATHLELRPVLRGDQVLAVVEFALLSPMTQQAHVLLDRLVRILGLNLAVLDRARKTELLLEQTQHQEEALRVTEAWYRSIIESAPDGMMVVNLAGNIVLANLGAESMFGYERGELVGTPADSLVPGSVRSEHAQHRAEYAAVGTARPMGHGNMDLKGCRKDGSEFPIEVGLSTLPARQGKGRMVCVSVRDITERKGAERVLARQRATMQKVLDLSPVGMVINAGERLRYVNPEFSRLFGVKTGDPSDKVGVSMETRHRIAERLGSGERMQNIEFRKMKSDGEMGHFLATYSLIEHEGETGMMGWVVDISDRAQADQLKKEFISTVSHELRTPLTAIRGSLGLVVNGVTGALPDAAKPLVQIAHSNSERLILLVNDILDMEKLAAGRMEFDIQPRPLMPLIQQALETNRPYAQQHQVELAVEESAPDAEVRLDANRFMQVLSNLLSNAAKFSPAGQRVSVGVLRSGDRVRIEVRDRGPGIPEAFRSRIFQKFAQADSSDTRKKGGTGLGLNITKSIVERMGGQIGFESQPHVLTTFFIEFPLVSPAAAPRLPEPGPKAEESGAPPASDGGVLICEDEPDIAALLRMMLQQVGIRADIALSAAEAKRKLADGKYRAITVDLDLPDQSGVSLIRELRAHEATRDLPVVVVSAFVEAGRKDLAGEAFSVADFIDKPIQEDKLALAIRRALRGGNSSDKPTVLHVEDDPDIATLVRTMAADLAQVVCARSLEQARELLSRQHFDLAILDLSLPDGDGMKLVPLLNQASPPVPVVVFSAREVSREQVEQQKFKAALLKSRTGDAELLDTLRGLLARPHVATQGNP